MELGLVYTSGIIENELARLNVDINMTAKKQ